MDPATLRADIPAVAETAYLNTGASGPAPSHVVDAASEFLEHHEFDAHAQGTPYTVAYDAYDDARERIAAFVGATPEQVALTNSTGDGISRVASAIDWDPGDVVVRTDLEHPAGTLPWDRLADREGIEVRVLETDRGRLDMDALKDAVADARLLCLSSLSWNYGTRLRVAEAVEIAHDSDCRVLVDAVQSPGHHPMDVTEWGADAVAAAGHKWLLSIWGGGFLVLDTEFATSLEPRRISYRSVESPNAEAYELAPDASRLEIGTASPAPHVALATAMDTVESVGFDTIEEHIARLTDRLKAGLGDRLLSPREYESGLVTFEARDDDPETVVDRLGEQDIVVRSLPHPEALRASVHVFNTADDIDRLLDAL